MQHSVMARQGFKRWWTRIIPGAVERSTFVLVTCVLLILMYRQWRSNPGVVWSAETTAGTVLLRALSWLGWGIVLISTFLIEDSDLFGLRQVVRHAKGQPQDHPEFRTPRLYRFVRHPIHGEDCEEYRKQVPMILPQAGRRRPTR